MYNWSRYGGYEVNRIKPFLCTYCGTEMTYNSSEGISYDEVHIYNCPKCNATCIQHENLSEDTWYEGE